MDSFSWQARAEIEHSRNLLNSTLLDQARQILRSRPLDELLTEIGCPERSSCPACRCRLTKRGRRRGRQRLRCTGCGYSETVDIEIPALGFHVPRQQAEAYLRLISSGAGYRFASESVGLGVQTGWRLLLAVVQT